MGHIYCCDCGHEHRVDRERLQIGSVVECPKCREVWARVLRLRGDSVWVPLAPEVVEHPYYGLLEPAGEDDE